MAFNCAVFKPLAEVSAKNVCFFRNLLNIDFGITLRFNLSSVFHKQKKQLIKLNKCTKSLDNQRGKEVFFYPELFMSFSL